MLYDITEVCTMLGTTSRTLRYYEEIGLIQSTLQYPSNRRKYSENQLDKIKQILALRALGLSIKAIAALQSQQSTLKDVICLYRADLLRAISEKQAQINLLGEVLHKIEQDDTASCAVTTEVICTEEQLRIADMLTEKIVKGDFEACAQYFSEDVKQMLPPPALRHAYTMTTGALGSLQFVEKAKRCADMPNTILCHLHFERMITRIKYIFHGNFIYGLWMDYTNRKEC